MLSKLIHIEKILQNQSISVHKLSMIWKNTGFIYLMRSYHVKERIEKVESLENNNFPLYRFHFRDSSLLDICSKTFKKLFQSIILMVSKMKDSKIYC